MSLTFDVRELVRIAIIDERSGVQLYRKLADQVQTGRLRDRFRLMAEQERRHEERFEELLKGLPESAEIYKHPDEYVAYLEALVAEGRLREQSSKVPALPSAWTTWPRSTRRWNSSATSWG